MNVREQVIKELEKTQKENEARRYERAKEIVGILWEKYTTKTFNYSNEQQFSFKNQQNNSLWLLGKNSTKKAVL